MKYGNYFQENILRFGTNKFRLVNYFELKYLRLYIELFKSNMNLFATVIFIEFKGPCHPFRR